MEPSPPPSVRSPNSPANNYSPSEGAYLDHSSSNYDLVHACVAEPAYSMAASYNWTGSHLPASSRRSSSEWSTSGVPAPGLAPPSLPDSWCLDYDPLETYSSSLHASYGHHALYSSPHASRAPSSMPSSHPDDASHTLLGHQQPFAPPPRPVSSFSRTSHTSGIMTPKSQADDDVSYGHSALGVVQPSVSQSPSSPYLSPGMPYLGESPSSSWSRSESERIPGSLHTEPRVQDAGAAQDDSTATGGSGSRTQQHRASRPKRSTRRLTTREEANYQCEVPGCGKLFSRSYNYRAHMETHDENREYPFACQVDGCDRKFVRKTDLVRHHSSIHAKERNHKCDYCGRSFARKDTLRRHMDDGCARRFDLGPLDLRTSSKTYSGLEAAQRPLGVQLTSQPISPMQPLSTLSRTGAHPEAIMMMMMGTRDSWASGATTGYQYLDQGHGHGHAGVQGQGRGMIHTRQNHGPDYVRRPS